MIEFGYAVACGDRHLPIDFSPQLSHTSRKVFQFARPPVHFPKSAAVATHKFAWGWVGFEIRSAAEQYRRHAMFQTRVGALMLAAPCSLAAGCISHDVGLADRCADFMRRAYPSATIEITKSEATVTT